jgi:hypothetical protein
MTRHMDPFDATLAALWGSESADDSGIDWEAIGLPQPAHLDSHTREALHLIEPPPPAPWRRIAHPYQMEAALSLALYILMLAGRGSGKTFTASHTGPRCSKAWSPTMPRGTRTFTSSARPQWTTRPTCPTSS